MTAAHADRFEKRHIEGASHMDLKPSADGADRIHVLFSARPMCRESRKMTLELLLSKHKKKCLSCERNHNCELQKLSLGYGVDEDRFKGEDFVLPID